MYLFQTFIIRDDDQCRTDIKYNRLLSRILALEKIIKQIKQKHESPYIKIIGYNFINTTYNFQDQCKSKLHTLFFDTNIPETWILTYVDYNHPKSKQKIVFVYLVSYSVKCYVKCLLSNYLLKHYANTVLIK